MIYFSYGSNLSHTQMRQRCPHAYFVGVAKLDGFELVFDGYSARWGSAVANLHPKPGSSVWGALYELDDDDLDRLDAIEGQGIRYFRQESTVTSKHEQRSQVTAYLRPPQPLGVPSDEYLMTLQRGRNDCGLPQLRR